MADTDQVLNLAAIIREVDGGNNKGAAALAESILDHPRFRAVLADGPAAPEPATWTEGVCGDGAALLKDGVMVPIEAVVRELNEGARARAALANEPAVPQGREPAAVTGQPSDEEWDALVERVWDKYQTVGYQGERFMYDGDFGSALDLVRKELFRWGHQPAPPADGEVAECIAELEEQKPRPDYDRVQKIATEAQIRSAAQYLAKKQHCDGDLIPAIRYAIARWGNPTPQPPAAGEVAELVAEIRHFLAGYQQMRGLDPEHIYSIHRGDKMEAHITVSRLTRAAELLERLSPPQPVPVSKRPPGPEDCDAEGRCWWLALHQSWPCLYLMKADIALAAAVATHWLPAHALPLPEAGE